MVDALSPRRGCLSVPAPAPLARTGTLVRLSAAPRPRSGDPGAPRYAVPVRREGPLLVFTYADGSTSAFLLPGASVTGHFEGTDTSWVDLRRSADRPPIRVHRGSVARVEVSDGRRYPMGRRMATGLGVGLLVGAGLIGGALVSNGGCHGGEECDMILPLAFIVVGFSGAAGLGLGTVAGAAGETGWREVPLDALGTLPTADAMRVEGEPAERELNTPEKGRDAGE